jgi:ABC-type multidrug transport system fused ATPase/permease subunit
VASSRNRGAWHLWRGFPRALVYLRPYWKLGIVVVLGTLVLAVIGLALPWPLALLVDSVLGEKEPPAFLADWVGTEKYSLLVFAVVFGFGLTLLGNVLTLLNEYAGTKLEQRMVLDLRSDLFDHCQRLSLTFHDRTMTGELMSKINNQAASVGSVVMTIPPLAQSAITLVGMFVIAFLIDPLLALLSLAVVPFIYYSIGLYGTRIVPRLQHVQRLEWQSLSIVHEAMSMLRVIVSFGRERYEHGRFRSQGATAVDERVKLTFRQTLFSLAVNSFTAAGTALVLGVGGWKVLQGNLTVGELLVLMAYIAAVYQPLQAISYTIGSLNDQLVGLKGSMDLLDREPEVREAPRAKTIDRVRGAVRFDDVSFSYPTRKDTLKSISFEVEPSQRVAIVGPTGAGKTTLISLIVRFYDVQRGRILIDGTDIRDLTLKSLRDQISVVLQEPLLFSGTIAENIRYGKLDAKDEEIVAAAKAANAHDFVARLPKGYETELGERGAQLSGGERQRLCVARAFIKDAPILILDEPTSSIDSKTENIILDALDDLMVGRTSFMIAHRLSTVRDAGLVLVLDEGELVEQGTHVELLKRDGLYGQLHDAQNQPRKARRFRWTEPLSTELVLVDPELGARARAALPERGTTQPDEEVAVLGPQLAQGGH